MRFENHILEIDEFEPVVLGDPIDWSTDPFGHPSWRFRFHSMRWLLPDIERSPECPVSLEVVERIITHWMKDNPFESPPSDFSWSDHSTAMRASVLARAAERLGAPAWLMEAMRMHAAVLADDDFFVKRGNHALDQSIALHEIAAVLDSMEWMILAEKRIDDLVVDSIDADGVTNEGAVAYQSYNFQRYGAAISQLAKAGRPISELLRRRDLMPEMLAYATRPDHRYEQIGDTYLQPPGMARGTLAEFVSTKGKSGPRPDKRVAVYNAGYVFGRSGWGEDRSWDEEDFYSIRFGSGDSWHFHGHADHTSITWHPRGIPTLLDGGFHGYERSPYRYKYLRAPEAHNVVAVRGLACSPTASTSLAASWVGEEMESYRLISHTYPGAIRERRILVIHDVQALVVLDDVGSADGHHFDQLWHFHPEFEISLSANTAIASKNGIDVTLIQVLGADMQVVAGSDEPLQGWVSFAAGQRVPAPTVVATKSGDRARFLTVLTVGKEVTTRLEDHVLYVTIDGSLIAVTIIDELLRVASTLRA